MFKVFGRERPEKRPWPPGAEPLLLRIRGAEEAPDGLDLPMPPPEGSEVGWAAGALDALMGNSDESERQVSARALAAALGAHCRWPSAARYRHLYELMNQNDAMYVVDGLLAQMGNVGVTHAQVAKVARQIATEAPDLGPVKLAIALLGVAGDSRDLELLHELGRFEELTLYVVVALCNLLGEPDLELWRLAKATRGWGRIQAVFRLKETREPDIKAWLLREGHRNAVMTEEIAYVCATAGGLRDALAEAAPDASLLDGAGELIRALLTGGPAEDINDYAEGPATLSLYIRRLNEDPEMSLSRLNTVNHIRTYLNDEAPAWPAQIIFDLKTGAATYRGRPGWRDIILEALGSNDRMTFFGATEAATAFEIDVWPHHFARQRDGRTDDWYWLMQTDDAERVEAVIGLAHAQLDLEKVGSGPGLSLGLGPDYADDRAMDFIVQDLRRFPGVGWSLVEVAVRGRSVRLRNMAIRALDAWGKPNWPAEAPRLVREAMNREPRADLRESFDDILAGRPIA